MTPSPDSLRLVTLSRVRERVLGVNRVLVFYLLLSEKSIFKPYNMYLESPFSRTAGEAFPPEGASWEQEGLGIGMGVA